MTNAEYSQKLRLIETKIESMIAMNERSVQLRHELLAMSVEALEKLTHEIVGSTPHEAIEIIIAVVRDIESEP